jgi:hypothetical protein
LPISKNGGRTRPKIPHQTSPPKPLKPRLQANLAPTKPSAVPTNTFVRCIIEGSRIIVEGTNPKEVQEVVLALMKKSKPPNPWISGSFYLVVFLIVVAALAVIGHMIPIIALPVIIAGGILALSVIGAFQMRHDEKLSQENFLKLMALSLKYLPWIKQQEEKPTRHLQDKNQR